MAFPTIPTVAGGQVAGLNQLNLTATLTGPNLNTLIKAPGDLLIAIAGEYQSNAGTDAAYIGWAGGGLTWTEIRDSTGTAVNRLGVAIARVVTGSETGTVTVTRSGTLVGDASITVLVVPGAHDTTNPEVTVMATGNPADPAALSPSWGAEDTLWIGVNGNGMTAIAGAWAGNTSAPTNYTDYFDTAAADTSTIGDFDLAVAFRQINAASEDMGAFGQDTSNARSSAVVIAVRAAAHVGGPVALDGKATGAADARGSLSVHAAGDLLVNETVGSSGSQANTTATLSGASVAGDFLVAFFARSGGLATGALTSVTDSASQSWTCATRGAVSGVTNTRIECWYKENSASITTVTFNSATAQTNAWDILEYSGIELSAALDAASPDNSGTTALTTITTPAISTANAKDLVLAACHFGQTTTTDPSSPWTNSTHFDDSTVGSGRAAYQVVTSTGSYDATWLLGAAKNAGIITVAFKVVAAGGVDLAGKLENAASALASASVSRLITGNSPAATEAKASASASRPITGKSVAANSSTGWLARLRQLGGTLPSAASAYGVTLDVARAGLALAGTVTGAAWAKASSAIVARALGGKSPESGSAKASASLALALGGKSPSANSTHVGPIAIARGLTGSVPAAVSAKASARVARVLTGLGASASAVAKASLTVPHVGQVVLAGTMQAASSALAALRATRPLGGKMPSAGSARGPLGVLRALIVRVPAAASASGTTKIARGLGGAVTGASAATGAARVLRPLLAVASSAADAVASLTVRAAHQIVHVTARLGGRPWQAALNASRGSDTLGARPYTAALNASRGSDTLGARPYTAELQEQPR